jgi:hypothetical protein
MECLCVRWSNEDVTIELRSSKPLTASSIGRFALLSKEAERLTGDQGAFISLDDETTKKET